MSVNTGKNNNFPVFIKLLRLQECKQLADIIVRNLQVRRFFMRETNKKIRIETHQKGDIFYALAPEYGIIVSSAISKKDAVDKLKDSVKEYILSSCSAEDFLQLA